MGNYDYYAITCDGVKYTNYRREAVLYFYEKYNCVEMGRRTKDLFPKIEVIIDRPNADTRQVNKNDIMTSTSIAMLKAIRKYDKTHTKQYNLKLNKVNDAEIIETLNDVNIMSYIKELIKNDIKNGKKIYKNNLK